MVVFLHFDEPTILLRGVQQQVAAPVST